MKVGFDNEKYVKIQSEKIRIKSVQNTTLSFCIIISFKIP